MAAEGVGLGRAAGEEVDDALCKSGGCKGWKWSVGEEMCDVS